jgi:tRNA(Ile)-lysidine synthase
MADLRRAVRQWALTTADSPGHLYLVALSGGGDSSALAWAAGLELPKLGVEVGAVIVDHQLQADSAEVAATAAKRAESWGLSPVVVKTVTVGNNGGPEEAARTARYQAFADALATTNAQGILLAHTEDDQAESVLIGLTRGSGPSSLKGMAASEGHIHRPLLGLTRELLRRALVDAGETWWEDPHNVDSRYTRVRVRERVLPVLEQELGPGVSAALARTAELFRQDSNALDDLAATVFDSVVHTHAPGHLSVAVDEIEGLPDALASRVIKLLAESCGATALGYRHIREMMKLVRAWKGQADVSLSGARVGRSDGRIHARIAS